MIAYTLTTWHYDEDQKLGTTQWREQRHFITLAEAQQSAMLYKLGDFIGYKIHKHTSSDPDELVEQQFDKIKYLKNRSQYERCQSIRQSLKKQNNI